MGARNYRGPVETVEQAMFAGAVLTITCQGCGHSHGKWAMWVWDRLKKKMAVARLGEPVSGFRCRECQRSVQVVLTVGAR